MVTVPDVRSFGFRVFFQFNVHFIRLESTATAAPETAQATPKGFGGNRGPEQTCGHRRRLLGYPVMIAIRLRGVGNVSLVRFDAAGEKGEK